MAVTKPDQLAEVLEREAILELEDKIVSQSVLYRSGPMDPRDTAPWVTALRANQGFEVLCSDDPRLQKMPAKPTLLDYFQLRFGPTQHLLQSANLAKKNGCSEKIILACLLHDISVVGFLLPDHGYWGAQLIEPYVDEEVSWAVRYHQALRFYPDPDVGYEYPEQYIRWFGREYKPDDYIERDYNMARNHKWYMSARHITINDFYAFDPDIEVSMDDFVDIIGRNFRQPEAGLGLDNSSASHMWRTIIRPTKFL